MSITENYNLYVEDDATTLFRDWREQIGGSSDSKQTSR